MRKGIYLNVLLIFGILFILGCAGVSTVTDKLPFKKNDGGETLTKDLFEKKANIGSLDISLIVKPGKDRIAVEREILVAIDMKNNYEDRDKRISGTYSLKDTPAEGGIQGTLSGNFIIDPGEKDTIDGTSIEYPDKIQQTQFLLDVEFRDTTEFIVPSICIKDEINKDVGIECDPDTSESGESSNSPVKVSRTEKSLLDDDFDNRMDGLLLKFDFSVDSDCAIKKDSLNIDVLDAAGITGFSCLSNLDSNDNIRGIDCKAPAVVGSQEFVEGPVNLVLSYICNTRLTLGPITLNRASDVV